MARLESITGFGINCTGAGPSMYVRPRRSPVPVTENSAPSVMRSGILVTTRVSGGVIVIVRTSTLPA